MRLVCPRCAAAYDVPPALLAGRRAIRCAKCGEQWSEGAPAVAEAEEQARSGEPDPAPQARELRAEGRIDPAPARPLRERPKAAVLLAWVASLLVLALAAGAAVAWRTQIAHAWPPSQRVYSALGLQY